MFIINGRSTMVWIPDGKKTEAMFIQNIGPFL